MLIPAAKGDCILVFRSICGHSQIFGHSAMVLIFNFIFYFYFMCMSACMYVHVHVCHALGGRKRTSDPLQEELQIVVGAGN